MGDPEWKADFDREFKSREAVFSRLAEEVTFALQAELTAREIKFQSVGSRVKELSSLRDKAERHELTDPLLQVKDIVGVRVVVLFLSDLPRVEETLSELFEVIEQDNKLAELDPSSFGYLSVHYIAKLRDDHRGPRYDELQGTVFEVQVRTIVMDAWASVSHYLDYKGETSIPSGLRRDFYALSGLFYVADKHFELFVGRSKESQAQAGRDLKRVSDPEANLDTVAALLEEVFPERSAAERDGISEFVEEIAPFGYDRIRPLESRLRAGSGGVVLYEQMRPPFGVTGRRYSRVGAARHALAVSDPKYGALLYPDEEAMIAEHRATLGLVQDDGDAADRD
jgi:putative GTP pyrophosphokinase